LIRALLTAILIAAPIGSLLCADLETVKQVVDPKQRAQDAMDNARRAFDIARDAYAQGEMAKVEAALEELRQSVELTYKSLGEVGKPPRKMAKHYKRAEIGCRKLLRRMEGFRDSMSYLDRETIDEVIKAVQKIQSDLLHDVMGGR
jgi:hypothetical protein